jgi:hypothetical protein
LHDGAPSVLEDDPSFLTKMPTHEHWAKPTTGVKAQITSQLSKQTRALTKHINQSFSNNDLARNLCTSALSLSKAWIESWVRQIDERMIEMTEESKFTVKKAWCLNTRLAYRQWQDLSEPRQGTFRSIKSCDKDSICAQILYSVFQTHDVMAAYADADFKDHPSMASEYVKFLATNSGFESVATLDSEVKTLKSQLSEALKELKAAAKKADTASNTSDAQKRRVDEIEKRLKKGNL